MSWDHDIKSIKCPCGNGTIEQEYASDDWNRTKYYTPKILCTNCASKYNLHSIYHGCLLKSDGDYTNYYLVDKNIDLSLDYMDKFPKKEPYILAKNDFSEALIVSYLKEDLIEALGVIEKSSSVKALTGIASRIAKNRKSYCNSVKINILCDEVKRAIENYDNYFGNYAQLRMQEVHNGELNRHRDALIKTEGILLDL